MVLTRLSSARSANTSLASSAPLRPSHHYAAALPSVPAAQSDTDTAHMALNNSNPLARPSSPLFGAAYPSLPLLSARDEAALVTDRKPVDAAGESVWPSLLQLLDSYRPTSGESGEVDPTTPPADSTSRVLPPDSVVFHDYFAHYGALGPDNHVSQLEGYLIPSDSAATIKAAGHAEPNSAPPLIPFGTASSATSSSASTPSLPAGYYAQPQARALAFDQELASPLFDGDDYYSPYLNDVLPAVLPGSNGAPTSWDVHQHHNSGVMNEWSPVLSDVSPAMTVSGDFGVDSSASPSPYVQDHLALFGDLSVTGPTTGPRQAIAAAPIYSPVISPTEMADLDISPSAMLPPPLPLISSVLPGPGADKPSAEAVSRAPEPPITVEVVAPATPPAEVDDDYADPDFVPSAPARPTRSAARRRRSSSSTSRPVMRTSASPAPTGTGPLRITDLSAPVQDRTYQVESRTSAKPIPKNLALRRAKKLARGESVSSEREAVDEASKRRMANTLAARESRKRKAEYLTGLEEQVAVQAEEIELLKAENAQLLERLSSLGGASERVKIEVDEQVRDDEALHDTRAHKKRRAGYA
ncbi:hypothetical protein B0A53_04683 [Rhodotorula sp. CCFEE 5036]|nr:hypothetical protein B0A53_04683 [Rhodotorula sp. CCFEE 5036]